MKYRIVADSAANVYVEDKVSFAYAPLKIVAGDTTILYFILNLLVLFSILSVSKNLICINYQFLNNLSSSIKHLGWGFP